MSGPIVTGSGQTQTTQYNITGGTRPGGATGTNLFHSFGDFNVPTNNIANFLNSGSVDSTGNLLPAGLATTNILGRVTGGNPSVIFGLIQTNGPNGFGNANLFLMNPYGFLFGPNATVNVGGMVAFTTADYLRFQGTQTLFNNASTPESLSPLSMAPVAAFGFLGNNPAAIAIQGSTLQVAQGQTLSLVGGNQGFMYTDPDSGNPAAAPVPGGVTITGGKLLAPGGQINLASVASPGEVLAGTLNYAPNVAGQSFGALGSINISQQSVIDVSGSGGGTVLIRGGSFVLDNSTISANITGPGPAINGAETIGGGIDIVVSQNAEILTGSLLQTNVLGNATPGVTYGGTHIKADRIEIIGDPGFDFVNGPFTEIHSDVGSGSTGGNSGPIKLEANSILLQDFVTLGTLTQGAGNGGDVILRTTGNLELNGPIIQADSIGPGNAGNIELTSMQGDILMTNAPFITSQASGSGTVGHITVNAPVGEVFLGSLEFCCSGVVFIHDSGTAGIPGKGGIQITAKDLTIVNSGFEIDNFTSVQPGDLTVNLTGTLKMTGPDPSPFLQSVLVTTTRREARSANLNITAHDILVTGNSLIATDTFRNGDAGTLNIWTQNLELTNGAQIGSRSIFNPNPDPGAPIITPSGAGGSITIQGSANSAPAQSVLIDGQGSAILTNTEGTGAGGNMTLFTNSLTLQNGGTLSAATSGTAPSATGGTILVKAGTVNLNTGGTMTAASTGAGAAGVITVQGLASPAQSVVIDGQGSGIFTTTSGTGAGGNISLNANNVTISNGGALSATTSGTASSATGGTITVSANQMQLNSGATITADSTGGGAADAGDINLTATNGLSMQNSSITTQVTPTGTSSAGGGNITITTSPAATVYLQDSKISASVADGPGGGGNISIDPQFVILQNSQILAQAAQGQGGAITITAGLFLPDGSSVINADSGSGQNGTITIQSPIAPASGKILPLPQKPLIATILLSQRCAALAGGNYSSFTVAGRDSLPTEPAGWLSSPLALATLSAGEGRPPLTPPYQGGGDGEGETPVLSLRRIAPPGFLTQAFAADWSAGCTS